MKDARHVIVLTTAERGGMRAVVEAYEADGVFDRWNVRLLHSHVEGGILRRAIAAANSLLRLSFLLLRKRVSLLHCHVSMGASFWRKSLFADLALIFRVPVILHLHGSDMELFYAAQGRFGKWLIARQLTQASRVLVLSSSWRDFVLKVAPAARTVVVPNYVGLPSSLPHGGVHDGIRVVFLGALGRRKGIFDLLPAYKQAIARVPAMKLFLGGNGELAEVAAVISRLQLGSSVEMLGWVCGEQKAQLLGSADIFVLPSYNEGLPMSVLEAMSFGVAIISTRVGGIPELVREGIDGLLIEPGDVAGLAAGLTRLAKEPALRTRMGQAARRRIQSDFSASTVLSRLEALYTELTVPASGTTSGTTAGRAAVKGLEHG